MERNILNKKRQIRRSRVRKKIGKGSAERPRLSVFRSNVHIYAQLIDDRAGKTLVSVSSMDIKGVVKKADKTAKAKEVGKKIAEKAKTVGIKTVLFDRGGYAYHGRTKAVLEGAREGGLNN